MGWGHYGVYHTCLNCVRYAPGATSDLHTKFLREWVRNQTQDCSLKHESQFNVSMLITWTCPSWSDPLPLAATSDLETTLWVLMGRSIHINTISTANVFFFFCDARYPLVMTHIAIENDQRNSEFSHWTWWFPIVILLVYQRVITINHHYTAAHNHH